MRRRFFIDQFSGQRAVMEGEAAHHLGRVLRAQAGQLYELSDGTRVWLGRIENVSRDSVEFSLVEEIPAHHPPLRTTLLLSVVKFDSFEWALEKATELGVSRIVPLAAARSEKALLAAAAKRGRTLEETSPRSVAAIASGSTAYPRFGGQAGGCFRLAQRRPASFSFRSTRRKDSPRSFT